MKQFTKEQLRDLLSDNTLQITFTKTDGSERVMVCTLDPKKMGPIWNDSTKAAIEEVVNKLSEDMPRRENPDVLAVWDLGRLNGVLSASIQLQMFGLLQLPELLKSVFSNGFL